jgi:hypothetical protein
MIKTILKHIATGLMRYYDLYHANHSAGVVEQCDVWAEHPKIVLKSDGTDLLHQVSFMSIRALRAIPANGDFLIIRQGGQYSLRDKLLCEEVRYGFRATLALHIVGEVMRDPPSLFCDQRSVAQRTPAVGMQARVHIRDMHQATASLRIRYLEHQ